MQWHRVAVILGSVACLSGAAATDRLHAQPAQPGADINRVFMDPGFDAWVARFERHGREVYDRRHDIVAATGVKAGMVVADIGVPRELIPGRKEVRPGA